MSIRFEYPELLHVTGVLLMITNNFTWGISFCALGLIAVVGRLGNEINRQEEIQAKEEDLQKELSSVGKAIYQAMQGLAKKDPNESDLH